MDFQKYFDSFPYTGFFAADDRETLFFIQETPDGKLLHKIHLSSDLDLEKAEVVLERDLNSCSFAPLRYDAANNILYAIADENHDERYNLWRVDAGKKSIEKVTNSDFAAGAMLSDDLQYFYYGDRKILENRSFVTTFKKLNLKTGESEDLFSDKGWAYRHAWNEPLITSDRFFVPLSFNNMRQQTNLAEVNLREGTMRTLLPKSWEDGWINFLWKHPIGGKIYLESAHEKHANTYTYDLENGDLKAVTNFQRRNQGLQIIEQNDQMSILALFPVPEQDGSELVVIDLQSGATRLKVLEGNCSLMASTTDIWISSTQMSQPTKHARLNLATLEPEIEFTPSLRPPSELVHSTQKYLKYQSFDGAEVPAYLALPARGPVRAAIVRSFYGGSNEYRAADQILLEQGFAVLSPAVRGSWGWGKEWEEKIRGDLGGNEILDVVWGAKFLERELGLTPKRIGIEGGSHGGYAVLRALTMPDGFAGVDSKYPWGFGLCWAGFADLVKFHEESWISDWLTMMLGELAANRELYKNRSPLTHFSELKSPLFIVHGTHDRRVPTSTMTEFIEKLRGSDKPHAIHMVEGQGHTAGDKKDKAAQFLAQQRFLDQFVP